MLLLISALHPNYEMKKRRITSLFSLNAPRSTLLQNHAYPILFTRSTPLFLLLLHNFMKKHLQHLTLQRDAFMDESNWIFSNFDLDLSLSSSLACLIHTSLPLVTEVPLIHDKIVLGLCYI